MRLPDAVLSRGEADVRRTLLEDHGIEVGGGLGALAGRIWRIGLMGENARVDRVGRLTAALARVLG
jgi:alanine-glyoxylate transaminase/serine-glyoxylate transaminase/serine-pyruvate transaminase